MLGKQTMTHSLKRITLFCWAGIPSALSLQDLPANIRCIFPTPVLQFISTRRRSARSPPSQPQRRPRRAKIAPRRPQGAPARDHVFQKVLEIPPSRLPDAPKQFKSLPRSPQDSPRSPRRPHDTPRAPEHPRGLPEVPQLSTANSHRTSERHLTPERPPRATKRPKRGPNTTHKRPPNYLQEAHRKASHEMPTNDHEASDPPPRHGGGCAEGNYIL